jgi:integrase
LISQKIAFVHEVHSGNLDLIIDRITHGSKPYFNKALRRLASTSQENCLIVSEYISAEITEMNIKQSTKEGKIKVLIWLSSFLQQIPFHQMTKQDILSYLDSLRRPLSEDPNQKWIGSYNSRQMILNKFFRWLCNPDEPDPKRRVTPSCMRGVKKLPRQEKSPYKPSDLWDSREHSIFLRYCPSKRDRCYHAMVNDMSARPHEILNLKIRDIIWKLTSDGIRYAEILIRGGKTKPRTLPLIDSIPYVKDWISNHPTGDNPDSWLFVSMSKNTFGSKLSYDGLSGHYKYYYRNRYFPQLLEDPSVPDPDKSFIRNMLTKPWNLYIFRHSALTEKLQILKEHVLRDHAGWSMTSKMPQVYIHYFGTESSRSLLEAKGVLTTDSKQVNILKLKQCPNCRESNRPQAPFCAKCRMVLTYDAYNETLEEQKDKEDRLIKMEEQFNIMQSMMEKLILSLGKTTDQQQLNTLTESMFASGILKSQKFCT